MLQRIIFFFFSNPSHFNVYINIYFPLHYFAWEIAYSSLLEDFIMHG